MRVVDMRAMLIFVLACAASVVAYAWRPTIHMADTGPKVELAAIFPQKFGGWQEDLNMPVILPSPDVQAKLDAIYNQVLSRTYVNSTGERMMLSIAYGGDQSDGTRAHRPEVCYPAQGFQLLSNDDTVLDIGGQSVRARHMVAKLGARIEPITYWVVVGEQVALSGFEQKKAQLRYGVLGIVPDGMLVRVSSIGGDSQLAFERQRQFLADLKLAVVESRRARVFGS